MLSICIVPYLIACWLFLFCYLPCILCIRLILFVSILKYIYQWKIRKQSKPFFLVSLFFCSVSFCGGLFLFLVTYLYSFFCFKLKPILSLKKLHLNILTNLIIYNIDEAYNLMFCILYSWDLLFGPVFNVYSIPSSGWGVKWTWYFISNSNFPWHLAKDLIIITFTWKCEGHFILSHIALLYLKGDFSE